MADLKTINLNSVPTLIGDSGSGGTKGLVPAPASGDAAAEKFLKASGAWATVGGGASPTGCVMDFAGATEPSGWLLCFGQTVSRTTYADLFAVIGTTYGVGDGSTTFGIPDARGRSTSGKDDMGGSAASRITNAVSGFDGTVLGAAGGAQSHTLIIAEMPGHTHIQDAHNHTQVAHTHTQNSHTHTQNSHNHSQNAHSHMLAAGGSAAQNPAITNSSTNGFVYGPTQSVTATNIAATATNNAATATNNAATALNSGATANNQDTGGNGEHRNMQPTIVFNKIIKI
jgi:microcystin-dependent protein